MRSTDEPIVVTATALELMAMLNATAKTLLEAIQQLSDKLAEAQLSMIRPEFYTFEQAAVITNVAEGTLRKYRQEGLIGDRTPMPPTVNIGDKVLFPAADLAKWGAELPRFHGRKGKEAK
jgi:hypothetical protein